VARNLATTHSQTVKHNFETSRFLFICFFAFFNLEDSEFLPTYNQRIAYSCNKSSLSWTNEVKNEMKENQQRKIFDEWLSDYRAMLFKVIRAYAIDQEDQNDLFQEICLQIYRSIPNFKKKSAVSTWIYRISLNTAIKWSTREKKHVSGHQEINKMEYVLEMKEKPVDDRIAWLYHEIYQFSEVDRSLSLLLLEGYSYKEIADILGISQKNVGVKIHRIKKKLIENSKHYDYGT
jgi:RNA polymerase sigma-70 factor (ECF subfamily)